MALKWLEGFGAVGDTDAQSTAPALDQKYPVGSVTGNEQIFQPGRFPGNEPNTGFAWFSNRPFGFIQTDDLGDADTWISGIAIFTPSYPPSPVKFMSFCTDLTVFHEMSIGIEENGQIFVSRGGSNTSIGTVVEVGTLHLSQNAWHFVEVKILFKEDATGTICVRVDGFQDPTLDLTNIITLPNGSGGAFKVNRVQVVNFPKDLSYTTALDDWYVCDGSGSKNNDFLGNTKVMTLFATSGGDLTQWTPDSGVTNFDKVDEQDPDEDTTFVESNGGGDVDLYQYQDITGRTIGIHGVQIDSRIRTTDAANLLHRHKVKSGTTTQNLPTRTVSVPSYEGKHDIVEDDPDTATAWTEAGVNGAQFGQEAI